MFAEWTLKNISSFINCSQNEKKKVAEICMCFDFCYFFHILPWELPENSSIIKYLWLLKYIWASTFKVNSKKVLSTNKPKTMVSQPRNFILFFCCFFIFCLSKYADFFFYFSYAFVHRFQYFRKRVQIYCFYVLQMFFRKYISATIYCWNWICKTKNCLVLGGLRSWRAGI